jgi:hypothetical protein
MGPLGVGTDMSLAPQMLLQLGGALSGPLGQLLLVIVAIGLVVVVGRIVLKIAWRLVTIAALVVGLLLLASLFLA